MDDATFKLGHDCSETGQLVSRKNDLRFDVAISPWQAPWGLPRADTVYFTDPKVVTGCKIPHFCLKIKI